MKIWFSIVPIVFLFSCSTEQDSDQNIFSREYSDSENNLPNELFFDGNTIVMEEVGGDFESTEGASYIVQKIEKTVEDIILRAKRIPTKLYLMNQGISGENMEEALFDLKDEQLFYFEFEETQKQDLIKKYFTDNLDRKISYLSFDIYNDFKAVTELGDTVTASYSMYERNFHVAPFERVILSFKGVSENEKLKLIYSDNLFGKGTSQFSFAPANKLQNNSKQPS